MSIDPHAINIMTLAKPMAVDDVLLSVAHVRFLTLADSLDLSTISSFLLFSINFKMDIKSVLHIQGHIASVLLSASSVPLSSLFSVVSNSVSNVVVVVEPGAFVGQCR